MLFMASSVHFWHPQCFLALATRLHCHPTWLTQLKLYLVSFVDFFALRVYTHILTCSQLFFGQFLTSLSCLDAPNMSVMSLVGLLSKPTTILFFPSSPMLGDLYCCCTGLLGGMGGGGGSGNVLGAYLSPAEVHWWFSLFLLIDCLYTLC